MNTTIDPKTSGTVGGFSLGWLVWFLSDRLGWHLLGSDVLAITSGCVLAVNLITHLGLVGIFRVIVSGTQKVAAGQATKAAAVPRIAPLTSSPAEPPPAA